MFLFLVDLNNSWFSIIVNDVILLTIETKYFLLVSLFLTLPSDECICQCTKWQFKQTDCHLSIAKPSTKIELIYFL